MIQRLKKPSRVDNLQSESRGRRGTVGRWVYLLLVALLLIWLADVLVGKYLFFRADGLIMRNVTAVSVNYTASVSELNVETGSTAAQGDVLMRLQSVDILRQLGELNMKAAELGSEIAAIEARKSQLARMIPLAAERQSKMIKLLKTEEQAAEKGLVDTRRISEYLEDEFDSRMTFETLQGEASSLDQQLTTLRQLQGDLQNSVSLLETLYDDGEVRAPEDVTVSVLQVNKGSVAKSGETLVELLSGKDYVLAYVTPGSVYIAEEGEDVKIRFGLKTLKGRVEQILPISARLPLEFQRTFRPQERSQVMRIEILPGQDVPATFTKVNIIAAGLLPRWLGDWFN